MTCEVHRFEARVGGAIRVSLHYDDSERRGKSSRNTDTYEGRFLEIVPGERVVERNHFESDDPLLQGEMTVTIELRDAGSGTELSALHEGLPPAVSAADNEAGWRESLARLAALVEAAD